MGIARNIWREKRRREREVIVSEAVAEEDTQIARLKRRIAELENRNGNTSS